MSHDTSACHCYLFEAKGIQNYIVDTGRLRELVGGSELIETLCPGLVTQMLQQLGIAEDEISFSRNAGGAFYLFSPEPTVIDKVATLWPLLLQQYAPGLNFAQASGHGEHELSAFENAQAQLLASRSRVQVALPQPGPCTARNARSGRPALATQHRRRGRLLDEQSQARLRYADAAALVRKFCPELGVDEWPLSLTPEEGDSRHARPFPLRGSNTLAIVHADGNGLGQLLRRLGDAARQQPQQFSALFRHFSAAVERATIMAAELATREVLLPARAENELMPARPIVLGGDDLTMIVRADLALPFSESFLRHFEHTTAEQLATLDDAPSGMPQRLTACAGIAYAHASFPFRQSLQLAEQLCAHTKKRAKACAQPLTPSALAFHRIGSSVSTDWSQTLERELTSSAGDERYRHTLEVYAIAEGQGLPTLGALRGLLEMLGAPEMARGPTRQLLTLFEASMGLADKRYQRWRERLGASGTKRFDRLLAELGPTEGGKPFIRMSDGLLATPLGDINHLLSVGSRLPGGEQHDGGEA